MHNYLSLRWLFLSLLAAFLYHPKETNNVITHQPSPLNQGIFPGPARILLLTAHPDDECLFFAPTILSLVSHKGKKPIQNSQHTDPSFEEGVDVEAKTVDVLSPEVYSLCLSIGDADGLGETRKAELERSLDVLGIEEGKRWIVDHPYVSDTSIANQLGESFWLILARVLVFFVGQQGPEGQYYFSVGCYCHCGYPETIYY
jgi:N-acetylglucosaminylphosphatidylinositol deacetylase